MNVLTLPSRWQLVLASMVVMLAAIAMRPGDPLQHRSAPGVSIAEVVALVDAGAVVIDVRESPKTHLPGALLIPLEVLAARLPALEVAKTQTIVVYCGNGTTRGPEAVKILTDAGFAHAVNMAPGIEGWRDAKLPVVAS